MTNLDHWTYPTGCGCHPECPACAEQSKIEFGLAGLSENDLALHTSISSVLSCETAILDPDDADNLALVIVNELPPVYNAAPELLTMLERLLDSVLRIPELPNTIALLDIEHCRKAIENAKGD